MNIYHYHPETGAFLGQGEADPNPLEKNKWLIPACSTTIVPPAPTTGNIRVFANGKWGYALEDTPEVVTPEPQEQLVSSVSARQFKLQLLEAGLLDQVEAWVAAQPRAVQIAFEYSGTFVKGSDMMQIGFSAMGFNEQQIDAFFEAASLL